MCGRLSAVKNKLPGVPFVWRTCVLLATCVWPCIAAEPDAASSCDSAIETAEDRFIFEPTSDARCIPYRVEYASELPTPVLREFEAESLVVRQQKKGLPTEIVAIKNARVDADLLRRVCFRYGYLDVDVAVCVEFHPPEALIRYTVKLGPRFMINRKSIRISDHPEYQLPTASDVLPIEANQFVSFQYLIDERKRLKRAFRDQGFYFIHVSKPLLHADSDEKTVWVEYEVERGDRISVDSISLPTETAVPLAFIRRRIPLVRGDFLCQSRIERARTNLMDTGLFANVRVTGTPSPGEAHKAVVAVELTDAPSRVIGAGAHYGVSEGIKGSVLWQDKNFLHKAHHVGVLASIGQKEMGGALFYDVPDIFSHRQKLHTEASYKHLNMKAYNGEKVSLCLGLIQPFRMGKYEGSASILPVVEFSQLTRNQSYEQHLFGAVFNVRADFTNHRLYPTAGISVDLNVAPYWGSFGRVDPTTEGGLFKHKKGSVTRSPTVHNLTVLNATCSSYIPLLRRRSEPTANASVLAVAATLGSTMIEDVEYIPFDKRFYGGGRALIRSYGYQMSGELDDQGVPFGGASAFEACIEPRIRISEDFGAVIFWDCSHISPKKFPDLSDSSKFVHGIGFGVRYFTRFGPVRLDIAFPLKRRKDAKNKKIDKAAQFYISVGQTF